MKRILPAIFVLILAACGSSAPALTPQVTVTSEVTVTLTPIPTFTETPTATASPEPTPTLPAVELPAEVVAQVETQLPGYTLVGDQLKDSAGKN